MAFESGAVAEDRRSGVIVPLYKGKGERTECKIYRGISLLSAFGKIYAGILVGIKSMYINSFCCVIVKGGEREQFMIYSGLRQGCIMSSWLSLYIWTL